MPGTRPTPEPRAGTSDLVECPAAAPITIDMVDFASPPDDEQLLAPRPKKTLDRDPVRLKAAAQ